MKKELILTLATAGIALNSLHASAQDDNKYPASDFQPKVIYIDESAVKQHSTQSAFDPKYPASSFQPKVIFIDKAVAEKSKRKAVFDPKYPASSFEPIIIFPAG